MSTAPPAPGSAGEVPTPLDPDALAALEEERDYLLASLDDLDAEHDAGDVPEDDYLVLRDDYTARAAAVIKAIEGRATAMAAARPARSPWRIAGWVVGVVVVASLAGVLLARATGARGAGTSLTGSGATPREQLANCKTLSFQQPAKGIACYTKYLAGDPDNTDALTYRGWAYVRNGDVAKGRVDLDRVVVIDPTFPDVYVFRAVVLKNAKDFAGAQAELDKLYALNPPAVVLDTMKQQGLDQEVALGLLDPAVQKCWLDSASFTSDASRSSTTVAQGQAIPGFDAQLACYDAILAANPDSPDALLGRAALIERVGPSGRWPEGESSMDRLLVIRPGDPSALLLRAVTRFLQGKPTFTDDVATLAKASGRPSALLSAESDFLRQQVEALLPGSTTTTR